MKIKYVAFDGVEFDNEAACRNHERERQSVELRKLRSQYHYLKRCVLPLKNAAYENALKNGKKRLTTHYAPTKKLAGAFNQARIYDTGMELWNAIKDLREIRKRIKEEMERDVGA